MKNETAFTLIEVLVSMLVLSVGLLGLAGLQATSLRNNLSAHHRSQATQLAYDMADRMRVNVEDAGNLVASTYTTIDPVSGATEKTDCNSAPGCSPAEMAENDIFQWNLGITTILPNGQGAIEVTGSLFTITINWDDDKAGNNAIFIMRFQL